jgi:hypothetical protein
VAMDCPIQGPPHQIKKPGIVLLCSWEPNHILILKLPIQVSPILIAFQLYTIYRAFTGSLILILAQQQLS